MNTQPRTPFADLPAPQQAGILCNDPRFQDFAAIRSGFPKGHFNTSAAAEYLRNVCGIESRKVLTSNITALMKFQALRTEFDAWVGRISRPE